MPTFDFKCPECGKEWEALVWSSNPHQVCGDCGRFADKLWRSTPAIIPDDIPGGLVIDNLDKTPITVYSKSQLRAEAAARGLSQHVVHRPQQGSDKSPHTSRWI